MVLSMCSHIFVLDFGQLIAEGSPDSVRNDPAVKAAYLGDTPVGKLAPLVDTAEINGSASVVDTAEVNGSANP